MEHVSHAILDDIYAGKYDGILAEIKEAVRERHVLNSKRTIRALVKGDLVEITDISPKYLVGTVVEVVKVNQKTVTCKFLANPGGGRFRAGQIVRIPAPCVSLMPDLTPADFAN
jgi:hypothetical protein